MRCLALRVRAWLALGAFVGTLALPVIAARHLTFDDDTACGIDELTVVRLTTGFEPFQPAPPPGHCALCHWLRAVSGAHPGVARLVATWFEPVSFRPAPVRQGHDVVAVTDRPSRAPPLSVA